MKIWDRYERDFFNWCTRKGGSFDRTKTEHELRMSCDIPLKSGWSVELAVYVDEFGDYTIDVKKTRSMTDSFLKDLDSALEFLTS